MGFDAVYICCYDTNTLWILPCTSPHIKTHIHILKFSFVVSPVVVRS